MRKKRVIVVTDGDKTAAAAVRQAAVDLDGTFVETSIGIPTSKDKSAIFAEIAKAEKEPVLVLADDKGWQCEGSGEGLIRQIMFHPVIQLIGIVAVASDTVNGEILHITNSIDNEGNIVAKAVDKNGKTKTDSFLVGDTLGVICGQKQLLVLGMGDPGKMCGSDEPKNGSPITAKAIAYIWEKAKKYYNY
ncbi:MAG: stage V sporulation protein AE [Clostridia bacterium]|nr:stage V sporulation protein AE [Clostridia bacterium]